MMYFIKTANGISEEFYSVFRDYLLYGTSQGSRANPLVWLSIVMCFLTALTVLAPIALTFIDPWGDIFEMQNADPFVDDTSNGCNDAHLDSAIPYGELIAYGQAFAQIWEWLLYSLGGALELRKCFWYMVYLQWVNGWPKMAPIINCPGIIALTSGDIPRKLNIPLEFNPLLMATITRRLSSFHIKQISMQPDQQLQTLAKWICLSFTGVCTSHPWHTLSQWWLLILSFWTRTSIMPYKES